MGSHLVTPLLLFFAILSAFHSTSATPRQSEFNINPLILRKSPQPFVLVILTEKQVDIAPPQLPIMLKYFPNQDLKNLRLICPNIKVKYGSKLSPNRDEQSCSHNLHNFVDKFLSIILIFISPPPGHKDIQFANQLYGKYWLIGNNFFADMDWAVKIFYMVEVLPDTEGAKSIQPLKLHFPVFPFILVVFAGKEEFWRTELHAFVPCVFSDESLIITPSSDSPFPDLDQHFRRKVVEICQSTTIFRNHAAGEKISEDEDFNCGPLFTSAQIRSRGIRRLSTILVSIVAGKALNNSSVISGKRTRICEEELKKLRKNYTIAYVGDVIRSDITAKKSILREAIEYNFITCADNEEEKTLFRHFFSPYESPVWLVISLAIFPTLILIVFILSPKGTKGMDAVYFAFNSTLTFVFEYPFEPPKYFRRAALTFGPFLLMSVVITNAYKGMVTTRLIEPFRLNRLRNFEDVVARNYGIIAMLHPGYIDKCCPQKQSWGKGCVGSLESWMHFTLFLTMEVEEIERDLEKNAGRISKGRRQDLLKKIQRLKNYIRAALAFNPGCSVLNPEFIPNELGKCDGLVYAGNSEGIERMKFNLRHVKGVYTGESKVTTSRFLHTVLNDYWDIGYLNYFFGYVDVAGLSLYWNSYLRHQDLVAHLKVKSNKDDSGNQEVSLPLEKIHGVFLGYFILTGLCVLIFAIERFPFILVFKCVVSLWVQTIRRISKGYSKIRGFVLAWVRKYFK